MNVEIQDLTSDVYLTDARAMLTPEVMDLIVAAVLRALREQEGVERDRRADARLDRQALALD
jgi:hypothetical protein